jgi:DNA-binding transcriptional LysR family regulator
MDRLQAMQTFVRVVEAGSFSAIARETGATQGAVSKQIAALERVLEVRLLSRTTRSLALTEEGERYFQQARRLVAEIGEAEASLKQGHRQLSGWLHVAAPVAYGQQTLMPLLRDFMALHEGVKIDLRLEDGFVDLVERGIDVAIRFGELADSSLIARPIGETRRQVVAHRDYLRSLPAGLATPRMPDDLLSLCCIVYTELAARNAWTFTAGPGAGAPQGAVRTIRVQGRFQTNSTVIMRDAVLRGMGVTYAAAFLFGEEIARGEVRVLLPDWQAVPSPIHLVSPPARRDSAKVRAFVDFVVANQKRR